MKKRDLTALLVSLRENDTPSGEATLSKTVYIPFSEGVYSIRKEFAPRGSKFFPYKVDPFSEKEANRNSQKLSSLAEMLRNLKGAFAVIR